jgi:uncharacterized damage-inducible protein DinB
MTITKQIAEQFRQVHFGGNWTSVSLKEQLSDISMEQATTRVYSFNTIAKLVFHINYYVSVVMKVLQGEPLNASDKYSFDLPPIESQSDWQNLLKKLWDDAEKFAVLIEQLPDNKLSENLADPKYGNFYRNLHGIIEHTHYHLGQIALVKKEILKK